MGFLSDRKQIRELKELCFHPDCGTFVISGWRLKGRSVSFPYENGSHGGPGPEETDGFALLPRDIPIDAGPKNYLSTLDLRQTIQQFLNRPQDEFYHRRFPLTENRNSLRIMTYNVHSCIGMDAKVSPERIARIIARHDPDIVMVGEMRDLETAKMEPFFMSLVGISQPSSTWHFIWVAPCY